jgi:DNA-binding MarR family transcriptional regulator
VKLSEEIQQSTFGSVHTEAALNIHFTSNWLFRIVQAELNAFGISHEQYNILRILRGNREGTYCLRDVQERMLNRTANATRLVEKLRKRGLLSRRPNPTNRRMVGVRITQAGLDLLEEMDGPIQEIDRRVQAALSSEDASRLTELLERLRDRLDVSGLAD